MYKVIDEHIGNRNFNSALSESIRANYYYLGKLLGCVRESGDENFHHFLNTILSNLNGIKKDGTHVVEKKDNQQTQVQTQSLRDIINPPSKLKTQKQTKLKLLCNWTSSKELAHLWNKMSKGNFQWDNIKLVWDEEPDYYVVINRPPINEFPISQKTIYFRMEPYMEKREDIWGYWSNPDPELFLWAGYDEYNNNEWHLSKTYSELIDYHPSKDPDLKNVVSTVLSEKYEDPGHIKRVDFVKFLDGKGFPVHVYGSNKWNYKNYKGALPYHAKDAGLMPYKYTFNVENHSIKNYYTEKIIDGILSECLVFYSGCFNLEQYLPKDSFVYLELVNFDDDYNTIKKAIEENWWEKRLPAIREAKRIILEDRQFFPRVKAIVDKIKMKSE